MPGFQGFIASLSANLSRQPIRRDTAGHKKAADSVRSQPRAGVLKKGSRNYLLGRNHDRTGRHGGLLGRLAGAGSENKSGETEEEHFNELHRGWFMVCFGWLPCARISPQAGRGCACSVPRLNPAAREKWLELLFFWQQATTTDTISATMLPPRPCPMRGWARASARRIP